MKKLVLLFMLALCFITVSAPVWGAVTMGDVVYQGPPEPKDPPK